MNAAFCTTEVENENKALKSTQYGAFVARRGKKKKGTQLLRCSDCVDSRPPAFGALRMSRVWKRSERRGAAAAASVLVTWLFSSPQAAIMAGQRVKGATVAKHAGKHGLRVTLPPALAAL